ncbi:sensor histidine kinase [Nonomuraea sp. NPDC050383]|uniref:sensor histidine kinase n=1 Tax=Nonomuraea sp. NPDC050383 TaxID=3364362 RepID=UPI003793BC76
MRDVLPQPRQPEPGLPRTEPPRLRRPALAARLVRRLVSRQVSRVTGRLGRHRGVVLWLLLAIPALAGALVLEGREALVSAAGLPLLGVAVTVRRRWPLVALAVPVALGLALDVELLAAPYWPALAVLAFLAGGRVAARPVLWFFAAVGAAGLPLCAFLSPDRLWGWSSLLIILLLVVVVPWQLGRYRRQYAALARAGWRLADRMEREQRAVAAQARMRERARIAGDMHDSLGHDLTLMAMRAAALQLDPALDPRHQAVAAELRAAAAEATERLRDIVGVLRTDDDRPGDDQLHDQLHDGEQGDDGSGGGRSAAGSPLALVRRARAAGLAVDLERLDDLAGLPPMTALAAHRVVQEALTNAAKHAPGAPVRVRVSREGGTLLVTVANGPADASGPVARAVSGGAGLVGLDERVRLAGGALRAGPVPGGGFEVVAELPTEANTAARPASEPVRGTSATELARAEREVRRGLAQTVMVPLAVLAGILLLMIPVWLLSSSLSVLPRDTYDGLTVGATRGEVEAHLPAVTMDGPPDGAPPPPAGESCVYYTVRAFDDDAYRLCFAGDRLRSKAVVGQRE